MIEKFPAYTKLHPGYDNFSKGRRDRVRPAGNSGMTTSKDAAIVTTASDESA